MLLGVYKLVGYLLLPFIRLVLVYRIRIGRDDPNCVQERFGSTKALRKAGPLIWFHAAGVHDVRSLVPLIRLIDAHGVQSLLTTPSRSAIIGVKDQVPESTTIQYAPFDIAVCVNRFLNYWKPDLSITSGSEVWPLTVKSLTKRGISQLIVSGSLSDRSVRKWLRIDRLSKNTYGLLDRVMVRSQEDADKFRSLGSHRVVVTGDLTYDIPIASQANENFRNLKTQCNGRPIWVAAYICRDEIDAIAKVQKKILETIPDCLCFIIPQRPYMIKYLVRHLQKYELSVGLESRGDILIESMNAFVLDTMKFSAQVFSLGRVAFIGQSLNGLGGRTPVDAIVQQCAIVSGRDVFRHSEIYNRLHDARAAQFVLDADGLLSFLIYILQHEDRERAMCASAFAALDKIRGALEETYIELDPYLRPLCYKARMEVARKSSNNKAIQ